MSEKIVDSIIATFGGLTAIKFGKEILVFIISLFPILELRGGLIAAALLGLSPLKSYIICIVEYRYHGQAVQIEAKLVAQTDSRKTHIKGKPGIHKT